MHDDIQLFPPPPFFLSSRTVFLDFTEKFHGRQAVNISTCLGGGEKAMFELGQRGGQLHAVQAATRWGKGLEENGEALSVPAAG